MTWSNPNLRRFAPLPNETADEYTRRLGRRGGALWRWPAEVLKEWFFRHWGCLSRYAFLGYRRFHFRRESWGLERIPPTPQAWEGFADNLDERASGADGSDDWLARYMIKNGTWNTPIVLLSNRSGSHSSPHTFDRIRRPFHLLEGHRRLSFLNRLRDTGRTAQCHDVWIVNVPCVPRVTRRARAREEQQRLREVSTLPESPFAKWPLEKLRAVHDGDLSSLDDDELALLARGPEARRTKKRSER